MSGSTDRSDWHTVSLSIPFPSADAATLVKRVVEVDQPLRPSELSRSLVVEGSNLVVELRANTVSQARVALDHCLSDLQLVVQTMHTFGPPELVGEKGVLAVEEAPSLEVGLMGSWEGMKR
ncbi:hypothetical protein JCM10207_007691 [Rhodosporidiobolus poonsookiae]